MKLPIFDVSLVQHAVSPGIAEAAYNVFQELHIKPGELYVSKTESELSDSKLILYGDVIKTFVSRHCLFLSTIAQQLGIIDFHGFEIWTNIADKCLERVVVHVDNDEGYRATTGKVLNPVLGSILYLGPEFIEQGGGTCFFRDLESISDHSRFLFQSRKWEEVSTALGCSSLQIPFRAGDMVVFRGNLPHCVIPFQESKLGPRVAFLVNLWSHPLAHV